jgi:hypothetical protein
MPSYGQNQGIARNASRSEYPNLWRGLVGCWCPSAGQMGDLLPDFSPSRANAKFNVSTLAPSSRGTALTLSGASQQYATIESSFAAPQQMTLSLWLKADSWPTNATVIGSRTTGLFLVDFNSGALNSFFGSTGSTNVGGLGTGTLSAGLWYFLAITRTGADGSASYSGFLNGLRTGSATNKGATRSTAIQIGRDSNNSRYFPGQIDSIMMHSRVLADAEIFALYMGAHPLTPALYVQQRGAAANSILRHRTASRARHLLAA